MLDAANQANINIFSSKINFYEINVRDRYVTLDRISFVLEWYLDQLQGDENAGCNAMFQLKYGYFTKCTK